MSEEVCVEFKEPDYGDEVDMYDLAKEKAEWLELHEGYDFHTNDDKRELCGDIRLITKVVGGIYSDGSKMMYQAKSIASNVNIKGLEWVSRE